MAEYVHPDEVSVPVPRTLLLDVMATLLAATQYIALPGQRRRLEDAARQVEELLLAAEEGRRTK